jgi:hypothetical protein
MSDSFAYSFTITEEKHLQANFKLVLDLLIDYLKDNYRNVRVEKSGTGTVSKDDYSATESYTAVSGSNFVIMLGWADTTSDLELKLYNPSGLEVKPQGMFTLGDTRVIMAEVKDAAVGTWTYRVFGKKTPYSGQLYTAKVARIDIAGSGTEQPGTSDPTKGDVNNDGRINVEDIVLIMRDILGLESLTIEQRQRADMNGDGRVDVVDAALLQQKILGL